MSYLCFAVIFSCVVSCAQASNILVVGGGGREHALAWKIAQSEQVQTVFVAPGNAGIAREPKIQIVPITATDLPTLVKFAQEHAIDLTIVGPEVPLAAGIVDTFAQQGLRCFGPTQAAAQLEASKAFSKEFMQRHGIPTAQARIFTDAEAAKAYVRTQSLPVVIKADGLAAGKGVVIAQTLQEAEETIDQMLVGKTFGDAGCTVVIEEFLSGQEVSFIVMVDGEHVLPLATSQDHKKRDNGEQGPNTGGMGAYSPAPIITPELHERIMQEVIIPTVRGMAQEGRSYTGFLYAGLMIMPSGDPYVLEFNCRLGDPEAQPLLMRLRSDLVELCQAALDCRLHTVDAAWDDRIALGVVMAAGGYPGFYRKGDVINGLPEAEHDDVKVFCAGVAERGQELVTNGGRVLCAAAFGSTVSEAQRRAYELVRIIHWSDVYYRTDIGAFAI